MLEKNEVIHASDVGGSRIGPNKVLIISENKFYKNQLFDIYSNLPQQILYEINADFEEINNAHNDGMQELTRPRS